MAKQTVSIIGAGLSGLTLSRSLQQRGIPTILYERTSSPAQHNYGITLHASAYTPLLKLLDVDDQAFKSRVAVDAAIGGTGKIKTGDASQSSSFRANRGKLEQWLREGVNIRWEYKVHDAQRSSLSDASLTLYFTNGEKTQSDIVLGADGAHSAVRQAVLPERQLAILPFVVFNGKRRMSLDAFDKKVARHMQDSNVRNIQVGDARLNISVDNYTTDKVAISWTYSRRARGQEDGLYTPKRTLAAATTIPEEFFQEVAMLRQKDGSALVAEIFDEEILRQDRILHWLMRTVIVSKEDADRLAQDGIVLLGDAAHASPIVGGSGANEAISDALSLALRIDGGTLELQRWVNERYAAMQAGVCRAEEGIEKAHPTSTQHL